MTSLIALLLVEIALPACSSLPSLPHFPSLLELCQAAVDKHFILQKCSTIRLQISPLSLQYSLCDAPPLCIVPNTRSDPRFLRPAAVTDCYLRFLDALFLSPHKAPWRQPHKHQHCIGEHNRKPSISFQQSYSDDYPVTCETLSRGERCRLPLKVKLDFNDNILPHTRLTHNHAAGDHALDALPRLALHGDVEARDGAYRLRREPRRSYAYGHKHG
jgi:hypothetical protein